MIEVFVLAVLAIAYLVTILQFDPNANGPFKADDVFVIDGNVDCGAVTVFDRVRRLFGAYRTENKAGVVVWAVFEPRMEVFRCATCLSFWLSSLVSVPYVVWLAYHLHDLRTLILLPIVHLAITMLAALIARLYQVVMLLEDKLGE